MIDERTEVLINRRLDGELMEDEALELNKRLIRSPEARHLFEEYERMDSAAADALHSFLSTENPAQPERNIAAIVEHRGWASRLGIGIRAVAAALLLATMIHVPASWRTGSPVTDPSRPDGSIPMSAAAAPMTLASDPLAVEGPREETQRLHRNVVGVWDEETQSVYVLELDQRAQRVVPVTRNF